MELFKKDLQIEIPLLDKLTAQEIYKKFKELGDKENVIDTGLFFPEHIFDIMKEIEGLYKVAYDAMMSDNAPTSIQELESVLTSDLLSIPTFVKDFIDYVMVYKENTTREEFKEQFILLKGQNEIT